MKYMTYAVYDSKAQRYIFPQNYVRREEAVRAFSMACNQPDTDFFRYAEDYSLFEIGQYDEDIGLHYPHTAPIMIITAVLASEKHKEYYSTSLSKVVNQ